MIEEAMRKFWEGDKNNKYSQPFNIRPIKTEERIHSWGKWEITKEFDITPSWPLGLYLLQKRTCDGCGFTQISLQKILI